MSAAVNPVVDNVEEITPEWLTQVLGVRVGGVVAERIGTGQIGRNYRLTLTFADQTDVADAPNSLVVKLAAGDLGARQRVAAGYKKELGFYSHLASTVDVLAPACRWCAIADDALSFTLVLEDLAPATAGVQVDGCTPERARGALANLAALHAPRWNDPTLLDHDFLTPMDPSYAGFLGQLYQQATVDFLARLGDELASADRTTLAAVGEVIGTWHLARLEPFALVHGDFRLDNLMFPPTGPPIAVDWQTATVAPPARDVAYFLATALHTQDRRAAEESLVASYHADLVARGVADYPLPACFDDYRLGQFQGPWIALVGSMMATADRTRASDDMFLSMVTRSCAAIRDLKSLDLL